MVTNSNFLSADSDRAMQKAFSKKIDTKLTKLRSYSVTGTKIVEEEELVETLVEPDAWYAENKKRADRSLPFFLMQGGKAPLSFQSPKGAQKL